jgi:signal transduction histidine kinase
VELERTAWRKGRAEAEAVESKCVRAFTRAAELCLRRADLIAHDAGSEMFVAALTGVARRSNGLAFPADCRIILSRLCVALEDAADVGMQSGWILVRPERLRAEFESSVDAALERGSIERERFGFFSTLGHELRSPITAVRGYLETVLQQSDLDPQVSRQFLEVALAETLRLSRLVDGLFDISLLDMREERPRNESADLECSLKDALNAVFNVACSRNVSIDCQGVRPVRVAMNGDRLSQALINLIENAIKHGREQGYVRISSRLNERFVEINVEDDGPGVPAHERESIFKLAWQSETTRARGYGIGLAVVRLLLERNAGEVSLEPSPLGGARFMLRIPCAERNLETVTG